MLLIAGLGNPGEKYARNRHNVGFMFVDFLLKSLTTSYQLPTTRYKFDKYTNAEIVKMDLPAILAKPQTYMNRSGESIKKLITNYELRITNDNPKLTSHLQATNLFIAHDDLDIELGKFKIQLGVGPKKHNGLSSIEDHLHTADFWRIRIGVDNRQGDRTLSGEEYVLQNFSHDEISTLHEVFGSIFLQMKYRVGLS